MNDEEPKGKPNDEDEEVRETLDQMLGDAVEHQAQAATQERVPAAEKTEF